MIREGSHVCVCGGVYCFHVVRPSVRPSVRLSMTLWFFPNTLKTQ